MATYLGEASDKRKKFKSVSVVGIWKYSEDWELRADPQVSKPDPQRDLEGNVCRSAAIVPQNAQYTKPNDGKHPTDVVLRSIKT